MAKYITMVYEGEKHDERFGWDYGKKILFQSAEHETPSTAMEEFSKFELPNDKAWFAYMRVVEKGEVVDEEMFDNSIAKID